MTNAPQLQQQPRRFSPVLIGAGILVMALGFGLPMLTSGSSSAPETQTAPHDLITKRSAANEPIAPPAPIQAPGATGLGASLLRLVLGMAVVCGLCVLLARWFNKKQTTTPGAMEAVASIEVARCVIHLVRAGERRLLVGTDLGGVKAILELPGPEPEVPLATAMSEEDSASTPTESHELPVESATANRPAAPAASEEVLKLLFQLRNKPGASKHSEA